LTKFAKLKLEVFKIQCTERLYGFLRRISEVMYHFVDLHVKWYWLHYKTRTKNLSKSHHLQGPDF